MDLKYWRYSKHASDVPFGKPFLLDGHVWMRFPPTEGQNEDRIALLTGKSPGLLMELRGGACIYFDGEVAFEAASVEAMLSAGRGRGQDAVGCLAGCAEGFFAIVQLKGFFGNECYGVDVNGGVLPSSAVEDNAFTVIRDWRLVAVQDDGRRIELARVSIPKDSG